MTSEAQKKAGFILPETIDPELSVCIQFEIPDTDEYRNAARGLVAMLGQWWMWEKSYTPTDTRAKQAAELFRTYIQNTYQEGCNTMNCNDVVDCMDADPNYIALQSAIFSQAEVATQAHIDFLNDEYDGNPDSINPTIPTTTPDAAEQNALCWTLNAMVDAYCAYKIAKIQQENSLTILWNNVQIAMRELYNQVTSFVGFNAGFDLFACVVGNTEAIAAMSDDTAKELLACYLSDYLSTLIMSESQFNGALDDAATSLTGYAQDIACLMSNDNSIDMYVQFLEWYGIALDRQIAGDTLECPCVTVYDAYRIDFDGSALPGNWAIQLGTNTANGIESVVGGQPESVNVYHNAGAAWTPQKVRVIYERSSDGSFLDDLRIIQYTNYPSPATGASAWIEYDEPAHANSVEEYCHDTTPTGISRQFMLFSLRDNNAGNTIYLKAIELYPTPPSEIANIIWSDC